MIIWPASVRQGRKPCWKKVTWSLERSKYPAASKCALGCATAEFDEGFRKLLPLYKNKNKNKNRMCDTLSITQENSHSVGVREGAGHDEPAQRLARAAVGRRRQRLQRREALGLQLEQALV